MGVIVAGTIDAFFFVIGPFLFSIFNSFTNQNLKTILNPELKQFVGFDNYRVLFTGGSLVRSLYNTIWFVIVVVPLQTLFALGFAVIVNGSALWKRMLRTCFFLPVVVSMAVLAVVWSLLYNPEFGAFNALLEILGLPAQPFLDSPAQAMSCLIVMSIWQGVGFQMMIFLAGMQAIPKELYEMACIERANCWQQFAYITFPLLKNTTLFVVFITTIFAFKLFVQPHLITHGGPEHSTQTLILLLYDEAFVNGDYGKANAISVLFFLIVLVIALLQRRLLPREERA